MRTTYHITRGQQYDSQGVSVHSHRGRCDDNGRGDGRCRSRSLSCAYAADGQRSHGEPWIDDETVLTAIRETLADGQARDIVTGEIDAPVQVETHEPCPHYSTDQGCPLHGETCRQWGQ